MQQNCKVSLCIFSPDMSAGEISEIIGISADKEIAKGTPRGKSPILKHAENVWVLLSQIEQSQSVGMHIMNLCSKLRGYEAKIKGLQPVCSIQCVCVIRSSHAPELNFPFELIHNLSQLGASLDIDLCN